MDLQITGTTVVVTGAVPNENFPYLGWFVGTIDLSGSAPKVVTYRDLPYLPLSMRVLSPTQIIPFGLFSTDSYCHVPLVDLRAFTVTWLKAPGLPDACDFYDAAASDSTVVVLGQVHDFWDQSSMVFLVKFVHEPSGEYRYAWHRFYTRGQNRFHIGLFVRSIPEGFWIVGGTAANSNDLDVQDSLWSLVVSPDGALIRDTTYPMGTPSPYCYADVDQGLVVASFSEDRPPPFLAYLSPYGAFRAYLHVPYYTTCHGSVNTRLLGIREETVGEQTFAMLEGIDLPSGYRTSSGPLPSWMGYPFRIRTGAEGFALLAGDRVVFVPWGSGYPPEPEPPMIVQGHPPRIPQQLSGKIRPTGRRWP